jgi:hypothetical protein
VPFGFGLRRDVSADADQAKRLPVRRVLPGRHHLEHAHPAIRKTKAPARVQRTAPRQRAPHLGHRTRTPSASNTGTALRDTMSRPRGVRLSINTREKGCRSRSGWSNRRPSARSSPKASSSGSLSIVLPGSAAGAMPVSDSTPLEAQV